MSTLTEPASLLSNLTEPIALLIATGITLLIGYIIGRRQEERAAFRLLLSSKLLDLSAELHRVVACTDVMAQRFVTGQKHAGWMDRAEASARRLKALREELRYPLWDAHAPIGTLARLPSWYGHLKDGAEIQRFLEDANSFRNAIDDVIRKAYSRGRAPTRWDKIWLRRAEKRFKKHWDDFMVARDDTTRAEA